MVFEPTEYNPFDFANRRHIGPSPKEMDEMLKVLGVKSLDELIDQTVPAEIRQKDRLEWGPALSERDMLHFMEGVAARNRPLVSLIGQG